MNDGLSLADIAAVTDRNDGNGSFGGNNAWVLIILFALIFGIGGSFGGNRGTAAQPVTEAGLCNAMNFNNLENTVGRLGDSQTAGFNGIQRDLCTGFSSVVGSINQARFENQQCCCDTQKLIQQSQYENAMNTAAINANTTAQIQSVKDMLCAQEAARKDARINQLELQQAMCGVVRYPSALTYNAGSSPFCCNNYGYGCGCGNVA